MITNEQPVNVAVSVAGGSGQPAPAGTVTLADGSYSVQKPLSSGSATFTIQAGALIAGSNTLMANYSGDATYSAASGATTITVAAVVIAASNPAPVTPGSAASATVTLSAGSSYSGTMNLNLCAHCFSRGAQSLPACSLKPTSVTISGGGNASTSLTVNTTAASSSSALIPPGRQDWMTWSGGGILTVALLFGVPSWRRRRPSSWFFCLDSSSPGSFGCGGGGGSSSNPPPGTPATTAGNYTFSVAGTDATNAKITASTNLTITVQ